MENEWMTDTNEMYKGNIFMVCRNVQCQIFFWRLSWYKICIPLLTAPLLVLIMMTKPIWPHCNPICTVVRALARLQRWSILVVGAANSANEKASVKDYTNVIACFSQLTTNYSHYFEILFLFLCKLVTEFCPQFSLLAVEHLVTFT